MPSADQEARTHDPTHRSPEMMTADQEALAQLQDPDWLEKNGMGATAWLHRSEPEEAAIPVTTVRCVNCGQDIVPTRDGGTRPRDHNTPDNKPCTGSRAAYKQPPCTHCGKGPRENDPRECVSPMYHPETWITEIDGVERRVGNAAAAGEIVRVSGPQYQWLARRPPEGPRRAPAHLGYRRDQVRFYDLDAVAEYVKGRPGPGGRGPVPAGGRPAS
jgi:hypothetical protein